ncbi:hypothetical protein [Rugamonas aquatica]|uniref:Uncharacterized protein n=1 Tax=Rugamonas aquatica TaxID=2743357 RepID=A0A6A7N6M0_9BURK|nr:hypothetical protein [Rugamonas aquatica]MQA40561.1 hypothetical protein [Rugamonas aquatica]
MSEFATDDRTSRLHPNRCCKVMASRSAWFSTATPAIWTGWNVKRMSAWAAACGKRYWRIPAPGLGTVCRYCFGHDGATPIVRLSDGGITGAETIDSPYGPAGRAPTRLIRP